MTEENRIGKGGFGMVYKQLFHGKPMAMKCILVKELKDPEERDNGVQTAVVFLEKNISELRIQIATAGSGVIVPVAFVRQQNQEQDQDGEWIAKNYNIYIYPLYDCNLYELHTNYFDQFTEEIVADIIHQCFIRIGSFKSFQGQPEGLQIKDYLEPFQSLETLDLHDRTHNDIKPENFLVKFKNATAQNKFLKLDIFSISVLLDRQFVTDLTDIEIALTDFGMAGSKSRGGKPIFASPECFENKEKI